MRREGWWGWEVEISWVFVVMVRVEVLGFYLVFRIWFSGWIVIVNWI